jgi:ketosteroid isomerase-like protein
MSQENVERVRAGFEAFQEGGLDRVLDLMSDSLVTYRAQPDSATYHGKEGFLQATADWTENFSEWSIVAEEFVDHGDRVLVRVRQKVRGEASGIPVESDFWFLFVLRGSQAVKVGFYRRHAEALEAVGLSE